MRRKRQDARIAKLSAEQQAAFYAAAKSLTVDAATALLREQYGVALNLSNVARWLEDYERRERKAKVFADVREAAEAARELVSGTDTAELDHAVRAIIAQQALDALMAGHSPDYVKTAIECGGVLGNMLNNQARVKLAAGKLAIDERRVALLEAKAKQADAGKAVLENKELTPAEREQKLREVFGL